MKKSKINKSINQSKTFVYRHMLQTNQKVKVVED